MFGESLLRPIQGWQARFHGSLKSSSHSLREVRNPGKLAAMKIFLTALVAGFIFASCAPMTPQARIDKNPVRFASLPKNQQNLVLQGQITRGMTPDAVELAWGAPSSRYSGTRGSHLTERWDYSGSRPIYVPNYYGGYGYGYGPYGRGPYSAVGFGIGPDITYIPYRIASVWFLDNRVDSWEHVQ